MECFLPIQIEIKRLLVTTTRYDKIKRRNILKTEAYSSTETREAVKNRRRRQTIETIERKMNAKVRLNGSARVGENPSSERERTRVTRNFLDGLITALMLASPDQVENQHDDDQNGESGADGDRNHVVGDLVRLATFHHSELTRLDEWLHPEIVGSNRDVELSGEREFHDVIAGEGVAITRDDRLNSVIGRQ